MPTQAAGNGFIDFVRKHTHTHTRTYNRTNTHDLNVNLHVAAHSANKKNRFCITHTDRFFSSLFVRSITFSHTMCGRMRVCVLCVYVWQSTLDNHIIRIWVMCSTFVHRRVYVCDCNLFQVSPHCTCTHYTHLYGEREITAAHCRTSPDPQNVQMAFLLLVQPDAAFVLSLSTALNKIHPPVESFNNPLMLCTVYTLVETLAAVLWCTKRWRTRVCSNAWLIVDCVWLCVWTIGNINVCVCARARLYV